MRVDMSSTFAARKARILRRPPASDTSSTGLGPIERIDVGIRDLVQDIDGLDTLVTTGGCADRIVVYLEDQELATTRTSSTDHMNCSYITDAATLGQFLLVSHDPLPLPKEGLVAPMLGLSDHTELHIPSSTDNLRWIRWRFEPMVLSVLCSSLESARKLQTAALSSGFEESGISSIQTDNIRTSTATLTIRNTGLAFDSVIGFEDSDGKLVPMVADAYMRVLVELGNRRFQANKERRDQFRSALLTTFKPAI